MAMTVSCEKCGAKNPLGEIYCKSCGEKLNVQAIQEELQRRKDSFTLDDFKHYFRIVRSLLVWLALALVVVILVGLFLPVDMGKGVKLTTDERENLEKKYTRVMAECSGTAANPQKEHAFSQGELTFLANWMAGLDQADDEDPGFALAPIDISVQPLSSGYVRLVLRSRAMKKLKVYSTLVGRFVEKNGTYQFVGTSAKVGKISLPGIQGIVEKRFKPLFSDARQLDTLSKKAATVDVYDGQIVLKIKQKTSR
ncbi:MAG: zinc ribbon domain-containing protein [Lentisphaeria bacterium]|nr:zinc ribbon domain-containing protein [Lentisphaeria bacterium]